MTEPEKTFIDKEIEALVARLDRGEISEEEFQRQMSNLVDAATSDAQSSSDHSVTQERIQAASKRAKQL